MHNNTCLNSYLLRRAASLRLCAPFDHAKVFVHLSHIQLRKSKEAKGKEDLYVLAWNSPKMTGPQLISVLF